ncbi:MAG: alpha/beta hydrolase [Casimicrobium sp.]
MTVLIDDLIWREREYSPSSAIGGNYAPHIARYLRDSAHALANVPVERDLRYGTAERALIDFFPAKQRDATSGLLVFIHGGYWQELSKNESAFLAPAWHEAGFAHATVGYSLAPNARLPQIVDECVAALEWLKRNSTTLGFDTNNIVVAGSSAGAYLAAACAAKTPLRGIVPISGVFDVAPLIGTSINEALGLNKQTAAQLDLLQSASAFAPGAIAYGEIETSEFKRQSQAFATLLASRNTHCDCFEIAARNHFDIVHELADSGSELIKKTRQLFA